MEHNQIAHLQTQLENANSFGFNLLAPSQANTFPPLLATNFLNLSYPFANVSYQPSSSYMKTHLSMFPCPSNPTDPPSIQPFPPRLPSKILPQMSLSSSQLPQRLNSDSVPPNSFSDQIFQISSSIVASYAKNSYISDQLAQLIRTHSSIQPIPLQSILPNLGHATLSPSNGDPINSPQYSLPSCNNSTASPSNSEDPTFQTNRLSLSLPHPINQSPISNLKLSPLRKFVVLKLLRIARRRVDLIKELNECWIEHNQKAEKKKEKDELLERIRLHQSEFGRMDNDERRIKRVLGPVRIYQLKKLLDQYIVVNEAKVRNLDQGAVRSRRS